MTVKAAQEPLGVMYTVGEIAAYLRVNQMKVVKWIQSGELLPVNIAQEADGQYGRWRVKKESLDAFLAARTPQPKPAVIRRRRKRRQEQVKEFA